MNNLFILVLFCALMGSWKSRGETYDLPFVFFLNSVSGGNLKMCMRFHLYFLRIIFYKLSPVEVEIWSSKLISESLSNKARQISLSVFSAEIGGDVEGMYCLEPFPILRIYNVCPGVIFSLHSRN